MFVKLLVCSRLCPGHWRERAMNKTETWCLPSGIQPNSYTVPGVWEVPVHVGCWYFNC